MSLPVPSGHKQLTDQELALLATSPTWGQSPNGWFDRSGNEDDAATANNDANTHIDRQFDHPGFMDDDDGLPMSMELRGSDVEIMDTIHPHYWDQVFTADERTRKSAMAQICRGLKNALNSSSSVFEQSLPRLARLLSECPFEDVHQAIDACLQSLSKEMSVAGISMPAVPRPSRMFKESVVPLIGAPEPQATLFKALFLNTGRVTHLFRIMAWHPSFLEKFTESYDLLLRAEGPLPHSWRHYLAIISAARFKCDYVVKQQEQEFLMAGGDEAWLESPENCPAKLVRLLAVNAILAHQPWRLQPAHISELMKCADSSARWSAGELVQAFVILATFRGIAGLAIGMGINTEVDISVANVEEGVNGDDGMGNLANRRASSSSGSSFAVSTTIYDKFNHKTLSDSDEANLERHAEPSNTERLTSKLATRAGHDDDAPQGDAETRKQLFEAAGDASAAGVGAPAPTASATIPSTSPLPTTPSASIAAWHPEQGQAASESDRFWKYNAPYAVKHTDFDVRAKDYSVFHIQDWSWEEQAYELIERTYNSDFAQLLDTEFQTIFELTYHQVNGEKGVDTAPFRRSIWYYVHRIHGILHDDYNYATVNELLLRNLKKFTKDLSCTPFAVTPQDLLNLGYSLSPEEKCHIALLATEARKQAELMYALHSLAKHLASS